MKRIYNNTNRPITKERVNMTIDKNLHLLTKQIAKKEQRKVSNLLSYVLTDYINRNYKDILEQFNKDNNNSEGK